MIFIGPFFYLKKLGILKSPGKHDLNMIATKRHKFFLCVCVVDNEKARKSAAL